MNLHCFVCTRTYTDADAYNAHLTRKLHNRTYLKFVEVYKSTGKLLELTHTKWWKDVQASHIPKTKSTDAKKS